MIRFAATVAVAVLCSTAADAREIVIRTHGPHALREAVARAAALLKPLASVRSLTLSAQELDAYVAALLDVEEAGPPDVVARVDPAEMAERVRAVHGDQVASAAIVSTWQRIETLDRRLDTANTAERESLLAASNAEYLLARLSTALARTEVSTIGGRAVSPEGRQMARELVDAALSLAPDSARVRTASGDVLVDAGQPEAAEQEYRRAVRLDPESTDARVKLAEALRLQGKGLEAVAELRRALRVDAKSARAHSDLGFILRQIGRTPEALFHYEEARRLAPDSIDVHNGFAVLLASQGRLPEAAAEFREMIRIDPDYSVGYYNLATVLADMDLDAESAAALREVVRINPAHYNAHYNLGELLRLDGKFDDAAVQFREYLKLVPDTPANQRSIQRAKSLLQTFGEP
jgi:tetratricopeptide (TPR) repeat protein